MNLAQADKIIKNSSNWKEFSNTVSNFKIEKDKGDVFERFVQIYLSVNATYRNKLEYVWLGNELPNSIRKELNAPINDEGIDIYAKTYDGKYWSIQAKFRTSNQALNIKNLSTFTGLSFVTCNNIDSVSNFLTKLFVCR